MAADPAEWARAEIKWMRDHPRDHYVPRELLEPKTLAEQVEWRVAIVGDIRGWTPEMIAALRAEVAGGEAK